MKLAVRFTTASLGAMMVAGVAAARPIDHSEKARIVVQTHDLDLAKRDGQKQLDRRICVAAAAVCPYHNPPQHFGKTAACRREAVRGALAQRDRVVANAVKACTAAPPAYAEPSRFDNKDEARECIPEDRTRPLG